MKKNKWQKKPLKKLIIYVQNNFCNPYIRERDLTNFVKCISCSNIVTQAGHRFSVGAYPGMRFAINNIHGQEISCNHFKSGNIDEYDKGLINRHGKEYLEKLKFDALKYKRSNFKFDRFDVIQIGKIYKYLLDNKIWIYTTKEFNQYRDLVNGNK